MRVPAAAGQGQDGGGGPDPEPELGKIHFSVIFDIFHPVLTDL